MGAIVSSAPQRLRLGTRASLLALAQSRLIARALEARYPDLRVELVCLDTPGDRDQATPLQDARAPGFFSDDLDAALLTGAVDFTVHSRKDLDGPRPDGLVCAAIPARENPRDVVVFRADIMQRLRHGQPLRIGSSSARRQHNVDAFLRDVLPRVGPAPELQFSPLRGPVDRRLLHIAAPADAAGALDGVVLALAGLARLWRDADGQRAIAPALAGARWMVLPLSACPAAPGQGALALECRAADGPLRERLAGLHDARCSELLAREYAAVSVHDEADQPGFGATAIDVAGLGPLTFVAGPAGRRVEWSAPPHPGDSRPWDSESWQRAARRSAIAADDAALNAPAVFVAHWHAVTAAVATRLRGRLWVSGTASWRRLAAAGLWVEGCADNLGFEQIVPTLACEVLGLPPLNEWVALTHQGAAPGWAGSGVGRAVATYAIDMPPARPRLAAAAGAATHFFWGSAEAFRALRNSLPPGATHACGTGKTAAALRELDVEPLIFPSRNEWRAWLG